MNWGESHQDEDGMPEFRQQKLFYKKGNWWRYGSGTAMRVLKSFIDTRRQSVQRVISTWRDAFPDQVHG